MQIESNNFTIREAVISDAAALADILSCSWRAAFSGLLPPEELAKAADLPERTAMFESILQTEGLHTLIAMEGDMPCGLCAVGPSRDQDLSDYGELIAIHTKPAYWGTGLGKALMDRALAELDRLGYRKVLLWTFEENHRARRFYEKYGFLYDGMIKDSGFGEAKEVRYRWEGKV